MKNIIKKIEDLGFKAEMFDSDLLEAYQDLSSANVAITDNLINPEISGAEFGLLADLIKQAESEPNNAEFKVLSDTLPYIYPNMTFTHINLIRVALLTNDQELLQKYKEIFSTEMSKAKKLSLARLAQLGADYKELLSNDVSDEEAAARLESINAMQLDVDPLAKFSDETRLQTVYGVN